MPANSPLTQARDRIAELCGWTKGVHYLAPHQASWYDGDERWCTHPTHPIPASLDFVSKVWPDGWVWVHDEFFWIAYVPDRHPAINVASTGNELADRFVLLVKVLDHLQFNDPPAFAAAVEKIRKEIA